MHAKADRVHILLVEDDEDDRVIAEHVLRRTGIAYELEVMRDGMELMEYLRKAARSWRGDAGGSRMMILLDLVMPRKDGWDALREIRADPALRQIPVIVCSDSPDPEERERCFELGATGFVRKSFSASELLVALQNVGRFVTRVKGGPETGEA